MDRYVVICLVNNSGINAWAFGNRKEAVDYVEHIIGMLGFNSDPDENKNGLWNLEENGVHIGFKLAKVSSSEVNYYIRRHENGQKIETRQFKTRGHAIEYVEKYLLKLGFSVDRGENESGRWQVYDNGKETTFDLRLVVNEELNNKCYKILGVNRNANTEEIKKAYRNRVKQAHPDLGGSDTAMTELNEAYENAKNLSQKHGHEVPHEYYNVNSEFLSSSLSTAINPTVQNSASNNQSTFSHGRVGGGQITRGVGYLVLGFIVTSISYSVAQSGGVYLITTGLFFVGAYDIIRGIANSVMGR